MAPLAMPEAWRRTALRCGLGRGKRRPAPILSPSRCMTSTSNSLAWTAPPMSGSSSTLPGGIGLHDRQERLKAPRCPSRCAPNSRPDAVRCRRRSPSGDPGSPNPGSLGSCSMPLAPGWRLPKHSGPVPRRAPADCPPRPMLPATRPRCVRPPWTQRPRSRRRHHHRRLHRSPAGTDRRSHPRCPHPGGRPARSRPHGPRDGIHHGLGSIHHNARRHARTPGRIDDRRRRGGPGTGQDASLFRTAPPRHGAVHAGRKGSGGRSTCRAGGRWRRRGGHAPGPGASPQERGPACRHARTQETRSPPCRPCPLARVRRSASCRGRAHRSGGPSGQQRRDAAPARPPCTP